MKNLLLAVAFLLGKAEVTRVVWGLMASGHVTEEEAREWLAQLDAVTPQTLPLALAGGQAEAKKRGPGRPRKDGPPAGALNGADPDGVDLGALAAGQ